MRARARGGAQRVYLKLMLAKRACKKQSSFLSFLECGGGGRVWPFVSPTSAPRRVRGAGAHWTGTYLGDADEVRAGWGGLALRFQSWGPRVPPGALEAGRGRAGPGQRALGKRGPQQVAAPPPAAGRGRAHTLPVLQGSLGQAQGPGRRAGRLQRGELPGRVPEAGQACACPHLLRESGIARDGLRPQPAPASRGPHSRAATPGSALAAPDIQGGWRPPWGAARTNMVNSPRESVSGVRPQALPRCGTLCTLPGHCLRGWGQGLSPPRGYSTDGVQSV